MKWVYFIKPIGMDGPIKIGCSYSPDRRRETLEFWAPFPLEILAEWEGGPRVERQFHAMFLDDHLRHEWFKTTPRLLATIEAIRAGTFDGSALPVEAHLPRKRKNTSYMTDGWRYHRSVRSRLDYLHAAGMPYAEGDRLKTDYQICNATPGELAAIQAHDEPILAELKAAYWSADRAEAA